MRKLIVIILILVAFNKLYCQNQSKNSTSLQITLEKIDQIKTASYNSTNFFCYPGDTIPMDGEKNYEYFKEYTAPSDTFVGAYYVKFNLADTTKMTFAYDGDIRARINWEKYYFETDDFSNNRLPYRTIMAPFFAKSKALIEYALSTKDSLKIDSTVTDNYVAYKISIINERVELVGKLPIHIDELGSNKGVTSEYVLWINRKTKLPFKSKRTLPDNTIIEKISNLKTNQLNRKQFSIANYIPSDMPPRPNDEESSDKTLINTVAHNFKLTDLGGQSHTLKDVSSQVYMINLTSLFCGACQMSIPYLKELNQKYNKKDFSFVSIYNQNEKKGLVKAVREKNLNYDILLADKQTLESYKLNIVPTFIILDNNKRIKKIIYGYKKGETDNEIENTIEELL